MSISEYIDPYTIANEIRLQRQVDKVTFLVVEGHDDLLTFLPLVQRDKCSIIEAYGKESVLLVISILNRDNFRDALAVVDTDFDELLAICHHEVDNLIKTTEHDIEMMLIASPSFERVLLEKGSAKKIQNAATTYGCDAKEVIVQRAASVGCLRLISLREGLALDFDDMQFRFIDRRSLELSVTDLVNLVIGRTKGCILGRQIIIKRVQEEIEKHHPWEHICVGHDVIEIMSIALRHVIGSCKAAEATRGILSSLFRTSFSVIDFHSTTLFRRICEWEARNPDWRFIRGPCPEPL